MFVARMNASDGTSRPSAALMYLTPPLVRQGFEVILSGTNAFPYNSVTCDERELSGIRTATRLEVQTEKPDFVAFAVYDQNALYVNAIAQRIHSTDPNIALVFGGPFVTLNPSFSRKLFGAFPNSILINGEAELALPSALSVYSGLGSSDSPGTFVRRGGNVLIDNFAERVSLSPEQHESLEIDFSFQSQTIGKMPGFDLTTSRGCFELCSFCAASNVFRPRHVRWSPEKQIAVLSQAHAWIRENSSVRTPILGLLDDSFFYNTEAGIEFLRQFRENPLNRELSITIQIGFASLFRNDGSFIDEIPDLMLRPDGTPYVHFLTVGGDYWGRPERARNKGHREGKLSNEQIRTAIAAFTQRKIPIASYWLLEDEQTTIASLIEGLVFASDLLIDHSPYFELSDPEPVFLYTGTPMRKRILSNPERAPDLLQEASKLIAPDGEKIVFYHPLFLQLPTFRFVFEIISMIQLQNQGDRPESIKIPPERMLIGLWSLANKWKTEVLNGGQRRLLNIYLAARKEGTPKEDLLHAFPEFDRFPTYFTFFKPIHFSLIELLDLCEAAEQIPAFYARGGIGFEGEIKRRNPHYQKKVAELKARTDRYYPSS